MDLRAGDAFALLAPGALVAPTPVSALLHAVAVVKVGVFCVYRVYADVYGGAFQISGEEWVMVLASVLFLHSLHCHRIILNEG